MLRLISRGTASARAPLRAVYKELLIFLSIEEEEDDDDEERKVEKAHVMWSQKSLDRGGQAQETRSPSSRLAKKASVMSKSQSNQLMNTDLGPSIA